MDKKSLFVLIKLTFVPIKLQSYYFPNSVFNKGRSAIPHKASRQKILSSKSDNKTESAKENPFEVQSFRPYSIPLPIFSRSSTIKLDQDIKVTRDYEYRNIEINSRKCFSQMYKWLKFASFFRVIFLSFKDLWTTQNIPVIICYCNLPFDLAPGFK